MKPVTPPLPPLPTRATVITNAQGVALLACASVKASVGRAVLTAEVVESVDAETGDIVLQALERSDGRCFLRLGYRRNGRLVRGPVSFEPRALGRLLRQASNDRTIGPLLPAGVLMPTVSHRRA